MTDQLETAIVEAGLGLLRADALMNLQDGAVEDDTPPPYVLAYSWVSRPESADANALDGRSRTIMARWQIHGVGETRASAAAMLQRARTQLLDQVLQLPGYVGLAIDPIREDSAQPPSRDETTGDAWFEAIAVYKARITT